MNRRNEDTGAESSSSSSGGGREPLALNCPACGARARRMEAHFCATCGRSLRERAYCPADSLLASYHQQGSRPPMLFEPATVAAPPARSVVRLRAFDTQGNISASIALILIWSSLVPFIGILFCPLAVFAGGLGLCEAWLVPRVGGARLAASCIGFAFLIGGAQVSLFQFI